MDKAEILELAVTRLTQLHQQPKTTNTDHVSSYRAGYRECRKQTVRYLSSAVMMPNSLLLDIDNHLHNTCDTYGQDDVILSSATRKTIFIPERRRTSSPALDLPPAPTFGSFCPDSMFSPIASAEIRGHRVHSPMDSSYVSRCDSPFSTTASSSSSASGISENSSDSEICAHAQPTHHKSEIAVGQETPWRPW
jgi:hypothetical protein